MKVACGAEFSMVVDCKGNLYSFGCPEYGQLGMLKKGNHICFFEFIDLLDKQERVSGNSITDASEAALLISA